MIKAIYYRRYNRLTIEGHANSGEPGHDLVCAGVSVLAYTLAANVGNMEANCLIRNPIVKLESGVAEISCEPKHKAAAFVSRIFEAVCVGFEMLDRDYPQYISYEIRG